jgi:3'-phosphoadenosine 5'-phosphosulfate (PAPS) 3'-phosphatase
MEKEKNCAIAAARAAGAIIRHFYTADYHVDYKGTDSPVTVADRDANSMLHELLQGAFPDYGWLSEETADSPTRLTRGRVWVIDPLDGTKEFIEKIPEFAVSVALVENGEPIIGTLKRNGCTFPALRNSLPPPCSAAVRKPNAANGPRSSRCSARARWGASPTSLP